VVNRHKSAAHTDSPDGSIGLHIGGGMHCHSASNLLSFRALDEAGYRSAIRPTLRIFEALFCHFFFIIIIIIIIIEIYSAPITWRT